MTEIKQIFNDIQENLVIAEARQKKAESLLDQLKTIIMKEQATTELLTAEEVANKLRTSVQVIRNRTHKHMIPFVKIGRKVLYPSNEIEKILIKDTYGPDKIESYSR